MNPGSGPVDIDEPEIMLSDHPTIFAAGTALQLLLRPRTTEMSTIIVQMPDLVDTGDKSVWINGGFASKTPLSFHVAAVSMRSRPKVRGRL